VDPLYGKTYLPRKFKVAFAIPPVNDLDVFTNCLGFIAIVENDQLVGYNVAVGGGMGRSTATRKRIRASRTSRIFHAGQIVDVAKAVLTIHRDFGDRTDRKHARLKYVVEERGVDWTRAEVEKRAGIKFAPRSLINSRPPPICSAGTRPWTENGFSAVRRNRPREEREKNRAARNRGEISANRIPPDHESKRDSGQRRGKRDKAGSIPLLRRTA
jgi:sulfite reductase beta subunit-like hemoprotein